MRCVIARFSFDLLKSEVERSMEGVSPEPVTGVSVTIGSRVYPVMQVGEVITKQDRRDFTTLEMHRALTRLGFVCHQPTR
ncbi:SCO5918 family protein [Streptomyces sp. NPDC006997]|uniref:SCO5918 family protein n=1 Tax=Streptomyces sp. NPDC006997 TaxID=3155356 RepID=UPI003408E7DD